MIKKVFRKLQISLLVGVLTVGAPLSKVISAPFNYPIGDPTGIGSEGGIEALIIRILEALIIIAIPIIVLMIIYGGFMYVTARGNADQIRKATAALTYAIIGGVMVIAATAITYGQRNSVGS